MEQTPKQIILVVCTGNTCRSPMAEAIVNDFLKRLGKDGEYTAKSAGVAAFDYQPAAEHAVSAAKEQGLDLSRHEARRITLDDIQEASLIFVMSPQQKEMLSGAVPGSAEKIEVMDVPDPFGGSLSEYRACFMQMKHFFDDYFEVNPL